MKQQANTREKTTLIGHCQVCEREIKSSLGRIAHHGYERPGGGYQTGSCMGALELPFELGHDALDRFIESLVGQLASLQQLRAGHEAALLPVPNPEYTSWLQRRAYRMNATEAPPQKIEVGHPRYEREREYYLRGVDREIEDSQRYLKHQQERRGGWTLKDLEAISEEIESKSAAERAARKAEVDAKRAARQAKEDAKTAALAAKYAVPCEFAVTEDGRAIFCWSHGAKGDQRRHRDLPRERRDEKCWRAESYEKYGRE